jgi:hypothetical protein
MTSSIGAEYVSSSINGCESLRQLCTALMFFERDSGSGN